MVLCYTFHGKIFLKYNGSEKSHTSCALPSPLVDAWGERGDNVPAGAPGWWFPNVEVGSGKGATAGELHEGVGLPAWLD